MIVTGQCLIRFGTKNGFTEYTGGIGAHLPKWEERQIGVLRPRTNRQKTSLENVIVNIDSSNQKPVTSFALDWLLVTKDVLGWLILVT